MKDGSAFGMALAKHFNLPSQTLCDVKINTDHNQIFSVTVTIALTGQDVIDIGNLMITPKTGTPE